MFVALLPGSAGIRCLRSEDFPQCLCGIDSPQKSGRYRGEVDDMVSHYLLTIRIVLK